MPESRSRKKADYTPPKTKKVTKARSARRWVVPAMIGCWVLGLLWICVYYIVPDLGIYEPLGNWNLVVGMGVIALGFVFSTKWE